MQVQWSSLFRRPFVLFAATLAAPPIAWACSSAMAGSPRMGSSQAQPVQPAAPAQEPKAPQGTPATDIGTLDKESAEKAFPAKPPYSPYAGGNFPTRPFFGDTHTPRSRSTQARSAVASD